MIPKLATLEGGAPIDAASSQALKWLKICAVALLLIGVGARLSPLLDIEHRLFWQYMTEDGYLMQTIARNMAIGLGMTTSEGTIATNGVQPLATFLFAALHGLAGGSKLMGVALVTLLSAIVATASAWYAYRVSDQLFAPLRHGRALAVVTALLWFAAPHTTGHSMNGLETGLYYLAILLTLDHYLRTIGDGTHPLGWRQRVVLGMLLGITFLARNDGVFFIAGLLGAHVLLGGSVANGGFARRLTDAVTAGLMSLVVAAPWLVHNKLLFGSIVPISGISQSHAAALGTNLLRLPAILLEAASSFVLVPHSVERLPVVVFLCALPVMAAIVGLWHWVGRRTLLSRRFFVAGLFFVVAISGYYGLFFGAPHFLSRYTSPLAPFLWMGTCVTTVMVLSRLFKQPQRLQLVLGGLVATLTLACAAFAVNDYRKGNTHQHKQVVDWVQANVAPDVWVGAVQTGTLGFFHDRTINLDGKVNPDALRAILKHGHVLDYVVDSNIQYVADWAGVGGWVELRHLSPRFVAQFELVTRDDAKNLAVMRRVQITAPAAPADK